MRDTRRPSSKPLRSFILAVSVGVNLLLAFLTLFSAYGGCFDPEKRVVAAIIAMTLPVILLAGVVMMVIDLLIDKRLTLIILGSWIASAGPIYTFSPLNPAHGALTAEEQKRSFTLLTYNIMHFIDFRDPDIDLPSNATLDFILDTDADMVTLQECEEIWSEGICNMSREQLDTLKARYPYRIVGSDYQLSFLSKFPCREVELALPPHISRAMACYRVEIGADSLHIVNVHLKSIGLTDEDKELFKEALAIPESGSKFRREMSEVKSQLLTKLSEAFRRRAEEARGVRQVIDSIGGPFIVAGDFNDIPGCYASRIIRSDDMTDAYAHTAFGPCITFHADRFYFRIDQIFYRGPMEAVKIVRGNSPSSDHSSLEATFLLDPATELPQ